MGRRGEKPAVRILLLGSAGVGKGCLESRFTTKMYPPPYDPSLTLESRRFFTLNPHPPSPTHPVTRPLDTRDGPSLSEADLSSDSSNNSPRPQSSTFSNPASQHRAVATPDLSYSFSALESAGGDGGTSGQTLARGPCPHCVRHRLTYLVELVNYPLLKTQRVRSTVLAKRDFDAVILLYSITSKESLAEAESLHAELALRTPNTSPTSSKKRVSWFGNGTSANTACGISDRDVVVALLGTKSDLDGSSGPGLGINVDALMSVARSHTESAQGRENGVASPAPARNTDAEPEADVRSMETVHPLFRASRAWSGSDSPLSPLLPASPTGRRPSISSSLRHSSSVSQIRETGPTAPIGRPESVNSIRGYGDPIRPFDLLHRNESIRENPDEPNVETPSNAVTRHSRSKNLLRRAASQSLAPLSPPRQAPAPPGPPSPLSPGGLNRGPGADTKSGPIPVSPYILSSPQIATFSWERDLPRRCRTSATSCNPETRKSAASSTRRSVRTSQSMREPNVPARHSSTRTQSSSQADRAAPRLPRRPSRNEVIESWLEFGTPAAVTGSEDTLLEGATNGSETPIEDEKAKILEEDEDEDDRDDGEKRQVSKEDAEAAVRRLMLSIPAMECSAKTGEGVDEAFEAVIREVLKGMKIDASGPSEGDWLKACPHRGPYEAPAAPEPRGQTQQSSEAATHADKRKREAHLRGKDEMRPTISHQSNIAQPPPPKQRRESMLGRVKRVLGGNKKPVLAGVAA